MRTSCCFSLGFMSFWKGLWDRIVQFYRIELLKYFLPWFLFKDWFCIFPLCVFKMYSMHHTSVRHQVAREEEKSVLVSYLDPIFVCICLLFSHSLAECKLTNRVIIKLKNSVLISTDLFRVKLITTILVVSEEYIPKEKLQLFWFWLIWWSFSYRKKHLNNFNFLFGNVIFLNLSL